MRWRVFLACRCRSIEEGCERRDALRPGLPFACPEHGEQRIIFAKVVDSDHLWARDPASGWHVCTRCGKRDPGTHYGRRVEARVHYACGCVSHHPEILERFLYMHVQQCSRHGDGWPGGPGSRIRVEQVRVVDADFCLCGRCIDRRRADRHPSEEEA